MEQSQLKACNSKANDEAKELSLELQKEEIIESEKAEKHNLQLLRLQKLELQKEIVELEKERILELQKLKWMGEIVEEEEREFDFRKGCHVVDTKLRNLHVLVAYREHIIKTLEAQLNGSPTLTPSSPETKCTESKKEEQGGGGFEKIRGIRKIVEGSPEKVAGIEVTVGQIMNIIGASLEAIVQVFVKEFIQKMEPAEMVLRKIMDVLEISQKKVLELSLKALIDHTSNELNENKDVEDNIICQSPLEKSEKQEASTVTTKKRSFEDITTTTSNNPERRTRSHVIFQPPSMLLQGVNQSNTEQSNPKAGKANYPDVQEGERFWENQCYDTEKLYRGSLVHLADQEKMIKALNASQSSTQQKHPEKSDVKSLDEAISKFLNTFGVSMKGFVDKLHQTSLEAVEKMVISKLKQKGVVIL